MLFQSTTVATLLATASVATASRNIHKRDSWGPALSLGPAKQQILTTETTIYPGELPPNQLGYLFAWMGISNGTGDLIQSIVGSYPKGESECTGADADTAWCISSEVYGNIPGTTQPNQWAGSLTTADVNVANGITFNYTLTDKAAYTWVQTMKDAKTGTLLSTFTKNSGPMLGWGTALECDTVDGNDCAGTVQEQLYLNSKIVLEAADPTFSSTLGVSQGTTSTGMVTTDGGITWTIEKITIPAMNPSGASSTIAANTASTASTSAAKIASSSVVESVTSSAVKATSTAVKHTSTLLTKTSSVVAATSAAASSSSAVAKFGQCGGGAYTGSTTCVSGTTCKSFGQWYSQCL